MRDSIQKAIFRGKQADALLNIRNKALKKGIFFASIAPFYKDIAKGNVSGLSVPAFNLRTLSFDVACSIFRVAKKTKASAFIFEIAKSEMEYTKQTPQEIALCVLGAGIKQKFKGPIFLQGDHFSLKNTSEQEIKNLENLISQSLLVGFYNFDIDCADLSLQDNIKYTNYFVDFIKKNQPQGIEAAIGGEVTNIGGEITTASQLEYFLKNTHGLTKVSCQTGTRHGGNILPSGQVANVNIDFENIKNLGQIARQYGLSGVVQHGASTLGEAQFTELKKAGVLEVHLSSLFQNIILDSKGFPKELKNKMYSLVQEEFSLQAKKCETEIQFLQIFRKKALGVFKKEIWQMPKKNIKIIGQELEREFEFFFKVFNVNDTRDLMKKIYI